ncbi:DNA repair protein RecO [Boudabousia liubingyangii]|uniref:DNA repair protein RecO n=1 Tax=Boudabousia liubingyangii TaxID=1921764 RepID=A0A1Q5PMZ0_9ACTO|nr:DNA repair protein RecO [Boudabousia liubingyangii]OKL47480.1 DNA repair protein RecO [Boudabousia liubingyangii]OKL48902.1 DNA repair protein RecO [Boudabousia liubingyangii]
MAGKLYRDRGIVLRTHKLGEADRIVTLLTRERGLLRVVAKGIRRTSSKFGARLEPFGVVDVQLHEGRSLDILTQAELVNAYGALIAADYDLYTAGALLLECSEKLNEAGQPNPEQFHLLLGALNALARRRYPPDLVVAAYLLRAFSLEGWEPSLHYCANCGETDLRFFSAEGGGGLCANCASTAACRALAPEAFELLQALLASDWERALQAPTGLAAPSLQLLTGYAQWQLEHHLKSVRIRERSYEIL